MDYDSRTPLHIAAKEDRIEIVRFLIARGANVNAVDRWKQTPMYESITNRCGKVTKILASMGGRLEL